MTQAIGPVTILDGSVFVVSDTAGDIQASPTEPAGLFGYDTRFLSTWVLKVNGQKLHALSVDDVQYFEARFFLVPGDEAVYVDSTLSVVRHRSMRHGFDEQLIVLNHGDEPAQLTFRVDAGSDFADIFEVKDALGKKGTHYVRVEDDRLVFGYQRETFHRATTVTADVPAEYDSRGLTFMARVEAHSEWSTRLVVVAAIYLPTRGNALPRWRKGHEALDRDLDTLLNKAPLLKCDWQPLRDIYHRSIVDLAALRFAPEVAKKRTMPAAGLPWFMTTFGRDSIFTSLQALPFDSELAQTTLHVLADWQGFRVEDRREEEPGRIAHEVRYGESTAFRDRPHGPYYGTADATPLWVVLLDEYERWTGDSALVRELEYEARAALEWIDRYGDLTGTGYISYRRRNEVSGLENQCWKDSWDAISYRDGRLPGFPRATCELQGYAYDAKLRGARLAREIWHDPGYADRLEREAAELRERFERDFWIADREYYALALDADGSQVDALSSNIGHLLWSGIIGEHRAQRVVEHLMGPKLFSGWGIRTLGTDESRYNPIGYHVGTVWPYDNSIIAWGMRRYGYKAEAALVAAQILDAAQFFNHRLPEAFAGYERSLTRFPVQYPTACSPQAWSAGAPLLFLRTMLGLDVSGDNLVVSPALPDGINHLELLDIAGRWGTADAFAERRDDGGSREALRPSPSKPPTGRTAGSGRG
ncbi:amylo-alpha-1,6-glucosidase [Rugosimonospora africana]|uniref:Amylo-alpha-1,6-glucosidase n=1 Tax=Rugosimonospora africana TaxID=556532 RepID=A0A8J3QVN4_9ACTN|nr:amylo-alpha-1,6-glucosidase [Rugosimonospora africana]GIH15636.1 amylo-alpha-1,6-glucosidase [Rugosimonospora africana]